MRKTMSVILMTAIIGTNVLGSIVSIPTNAWAENKEEESQETKDGQKYGKELSTDKYSKGIIESISVSMGEHDATSDFYNNLKIDEKRHSLTDEQIKERFIIAGGDSGAYEEVFTAIYRHKYEETYLEKYRELRTDKFNTGLEEGKAQGKQSGQKDANFDFQNKIDMNSTKGILTKAQAVARFKIEYESEQYKENFYTGYRAEYKEAYEAEYRRLRGEDFKPGTQEGVHQGKRTGERDATTDFKSGKAIDATSHILSKTQAIIEFKIGDEISSFQDNFYTGYITEYKKAYEAEYRKLRQESFEPKPDPKPGEKPGDKEKTPEQIAKEEAEKKEQERIDGIKESGKKLGKEMGGEQGKLQGRKDFITGNSLNWQRAFKEVGNIAPPFNPDGNNYYLEGFNEGYKEGFEEEYNKAVLELLQEKIDVELGYAVETGEKDATADFYSGLPIDSSRHLLGKEQAIIRFKVTDESDSFKEYFYVGYMIEYKKAYDEKYRSLRKDDFDLDRRGYEDGKRIGSLQGEFSGKIDFVTPKKSSDWSASLKAFENQKSITDRYFLDREPGEYKDSFITGFREAYRLAYHEAYTSSNVDIAENNINYENVAATGRELYFKPSDGVGNLGGALIVPEATFYKETHIGISMDRDTFNYQNLKYKPVNHVYNVAVNNSSSSIKLEKPMTLELDYYGSERAGIYQLINGEWRYLYTDVSSKSLTDKSKSIGDETSKDKKFLRAQIPAGHFKGGKYAIFIDEEYKPIEDIKRHWAKEELYTFLRRGYIKGYEEKQGTLYYPNTTMKRAHFVELLGNVLGWDYAGLYDNSSRFKDSAHFGAYKDPINYAANMGYINGGTDGNFKPFDTITYQQVEWILRSVMMDNKLTWDSYEENIKTDKKTQTESLKSKKLPIKRGEVVYMLYHLQKENLI